jgi:hypothetical protein
MKTAPIKMILSILAGPLAAWIVSLFKLVLAPPYQGFSELLFIPLCLLGFPISIVLMFQKKLKGVQGLITTILSLTVPVILFLIASPTYLPSGMSTCRQMENSGLKVTYACADSSSDDSSYHREFTVKGIKGLPIMRITDG